MDCLEFRRSAGADPQRLGPAAVAHANACPRCAAHWRELLDLDARILAALRVPVPLLGTAVQPFVTAARPAASRHRWFAFAASVIGGVLVGSLLWVSSPRASLAGDLVAHMGHEPGVMIATSAAADPGRVTEVLERGGIRLRPGADMVSYASTCRFRGHRVPHLVVQTDGGPVTVMVLRHERIESPGRFDEQGYAGTILPAGPGSIAVIGPAGADLSQVADRITSAVQWK